MKKWLTFVALTAVCYTLTGCWNYREIESLSIVAGAAIEIDPENNGYIMYIELIEPGGGSSGEQALKSKIVESSGKTIFDAARNAIDTSGKRLFWSHSQIIIVSEEVARQGILDVIDWFYRDAESRLTLSILVAKGVSAKDVITSESITHEIHSIEIYHKLRNANNVETYSQIQLYQLIGMLKFDIPYAYVPGISLKKQEDKEITELSGIAIFKGDKLQGFLDPEDTKYFLYAIDEIQGGLLVNDNVQGIQNSNVSLEVFGNKTTVKPAYSNGKVIMKIKIETEAAIGESGSEVDYSDKSGLESLKNDMQIFLAQNVIRVIQKIQNDFDTDVFGFGQLVYKDLPSVWKQYENSWDAEFKELGFEVSSTINIRNTAHSIKTIEGAD